MLTQARDTRTEAAEPVPPFLASLLTEIEGYADLGPDWDSYGALEVSPQTIAAARDLLRQIGQRMILDELEWTPPSLAPGSDGSISFTWSLRGRWLWLRVLPEDARVECVSRRGDAAALREARSLADAARAAGELLANP